LARPGVGTLPPVQLSIGRSGVVMARSTLGLLVGFVLAFALVFGGFGDMLIVALFGAVGFVVPKVVDGELDASALLSKVRGQ